MKRYKLLKDFPWLKAGAIFFKDTESRYVKDRISYIPNVAGMKHERFAIHADWVEDNSEWFEEVIEIPEWVIHIEYGGNILHKVIGESISKTAWKIQTGDITHNLAKSVTREATKAEIEAHKLMLGNIEVKIEENIVKNYDGTFRDLSIVWTKEGSVTVKHFQEYYKKIKKWRKGLNVGDFISFSFKGYKIIVRQNDLDIGCIENVSFKELKNIRKAIKEL